MVLSLSWREFLDFRFSSHARIADSASTQTAPYSANIPPDPEDFLCQSNLDSSLKNRILRPLEALLEQMGIIDDLVPSTVTASISSLLKDIAGQVLEREFDVVWMLQNVARIVSNAITTLESSLSVDKTSLGTGKLNLITRRHSDNQLQGVKVVAGQAVLPRVLYRYATELQESQVYEPVGQEGGRAMAIKIWLQECASTPQADFGLFFSGISAILTERVQHESGEYALLISPHYHLYDDDDPPKYDFCTPHDEGGLPLLAVLTSLLLPNLIVDTIPQLPALVNPLGACSLNRLSLSTRSQSKQDIPAPIEGNTMIVDVGQTQYLKITSIPSVLLFFVDHAGVSATPRTVFRYESLSPANDVSSIDSPPLSPSGSTSSPGTFSSVVSSPLASTNPISWSVTISREIHQGNYARVWRGTLSDGSCISPVVVKMYPRPHFDLMKTEIKAYQYIYSRQLFDITPAYYGTFAMCDQYWAAIILADGGESGSFMDCLWEDAGFNPHELNVIWNQCQGLHSIGIMHDDFQPKNITRDAKGALRIVDFQDVSYDHSCDPVSCLELNYLAREFDSFAEGWRE